MLRRHEPVENARVTIITREGCEIPINVTTTPLTNGKERIVGAVEFFKDLSEVENLKEHLHRFRTLDEIISANESMQRLVSLVPSIAQSDCSVLIAGPSGVGKELFAQASKLGQRLASEVSVPTRGAPGPALEILS